MKTSIEAAIRKLRRTIHRLLPTLILVTGMFQAGLTDSFASSVALQWDAVSDSDLAGYKVYYQPDNSSEPFQGTTLDVQNQTTATIGNLDPSHTYYFAVIAYNTAGAESSYSNVVTIPEMVLPSTSISSPASNASVSGVVSVVASASDNVGVARVEFYVNGALQGSAASSPYVFSWDTSSLAAGSYMLMTKAYDAAGNVGESAGVVVVVVKDTTAPVVSLAAPANGATVSGTVAVTASAKDAVGISRIEIYRSGTLLYAGNTTPTTYDWDTKTVSNGSYSLIAKAYDAAGNVGQSATVSVTVKNTTVDTSVPAVSITSPYASSIISGTVTVSASATDNVKVSKVAFYVNGVLKSVDSSAPYRYSFNSKTIANGTCTLMAMAFDAAGNTKSSSVAITVRNP